MKKIFISICVCCIVICVPGFAQIDIDVSQLSVDEGISEKEKKELTGLVEETFQRYSFAARLLTEGDRDQFINFFGSNVDTYNDIESNENDEYLHPIDYVELANSLFPDGIDFRISNVKLLKLGIDDFYDYLAIITFEKEVLSIESIGKLSTKQRVTLTINSFDKNIEINRVKGTSLSIPNQEEMDVVTETMSDKNEEVNTKLDEDESKVIEVEEPEDLDDLIILDDDISEDEEEAEQDDTRTANESVFGQRKFLFFNSGLSIGKLDLNNSTGNYPFNPQQIKSTYRGLPLFNVKFSNSINKSRKLFLDASLHYELGTIETDISSFYHDIGSSGIETNSRIKSAQSNGVNNSIEVEILEKASIRILQELGGKINGGLETIEVTLLGLEAGISYELYRSGSNSTFLISHAGLGFNFISPRGVNNVSYQGAVENGIKLPTSDLFPLEELASSGFEDLMNSDSEIIQDYRTNNSDEISTISSGTESSSMVTAKVGISFLKKLSFKVGISAHVNYVHGITSFYSKREEDYNFLEGDIEAWNSSVLEQYHSKVNLQKLDFGIGVFLIFN